jgi:hypothetical protein
MLDEPKLYRPFRKMAGALTRVCDALRRGDSLIQLWDKDDTYLIKNILSLRKPAMLSMLNGQSSKDELLWGIRQQVCQPQLSLNMRCQWFIQSGAQCISYLAFQNTINLKDKRTSSSKGEQVNAKPNSFEGHG